MSLRPSELAQIARELSAGLAGARVQKVWAPSPQRLYLSLRQPGRTTLLLLTTEAQVSRISQVTARAGPAEDATSSLQRFFRQELEGSQLTSVTQTTPRTIELGLERDAVHHRLVAELSAGARIRLERGEGQVPALAEPGGPPSRLAPGAGSFPHATAAEALFQDSEGTHALAGLRRQARLPLEAQRKRLSRTLAKVAAEAEREDQAEEHRRLGELLRHHAAHLPRGGHEVTLTEYSPEGPRQVKVPLDPALAPRDQVERHFHLYRRLMRGSARARERLAMLNAERERLETALAELERLDADALRTRLQQTSPPAQSAAGAPRRPFREYRGATGEVIWVGRGGADNDALTFRVARPEHWWLHARGVPGAHVVVPLAGSAELPGELLLDAAHLAHHHSDHKGETQGEVSYTRVKFVRKVKKGAPGQVTYTREKTFWLRVEPQRLKRLLDPGHG